MASIYRKVIEFAQSLPSWSMVALFVGLTVLSTVAAMAVLVWLPEDHFCNRSEKQVPNTVLTVALRAARNSAGAVMIPLGMILALPLVPGPGLVVILLGVSLLDFPGKRNLERRLLRIEGVDNFVTRVRARFGRRPFRLD